MAMSNGLPLSTARLKFNQLRHYARTRLPWLDASAIEEKARSALYSRACAEGLTGNGKLPRGRAAQEVRMLQSSNQPKSSDNSHTQLVLTNKPGRKRKQINGLE